MLHDSVLGVELLLRQFQNIFEWWIKWKKLDNLSCVKLWNLDSLLWKKFAQIVCVNEMMKFGSLLFMCEHIWTYWTDFWINWTGFLNKFWVNKLYRFFYEISMKFEQILLLFFKQIEQILCEQVEHIFFMKFLWILNKFCCYFLNRLNRFCFCFLNKLNRFCVNKLNIYFYEVSVKFEHILLLFFDEIEQILCEC